jgi:hypothetical protein
MIIIGQALLIVFLLLWFITVNKNTANPKEKTAYLLLFVVLMVATVGSVFKIQHYPGASFLLGFHFGLVLVLIPFYLIYLKSEEDANKRFMRLSFLVAYLALTGLFLATGGVSKTIINGYVSLDGSIIDMTKKMNENNAAMYLKAANDSARADKAKMVKELSENLSQYITQFKISLLKKVEGDSLNSSDEVNMLAHMNSKDDFTTPTGILLGDDENNPRKGANSASELKDKIVAYREALLNIFEGKTKEDLGNYIGLRTEPIKDFYEEGKLSSWEVGTFLQKQALCDALTLDQLRYEVRQAESVALSQLLNGK